MIFGDVNVTVEDGNLGRTASTGTGIHVKIGASPIESNVPIIITNTMKVAAIQEKLGFSPLADANIDSIDGGSKTIINIPVKPVTIGTIGEVVRKGTGTADIQATGEPNNAYDIIVKITVAGGVNEAAMTISIDGGNNYGEEVTIPLNAVYAVTGTGITLAFTADAENKFVAGDTYSFSTTAPAMSNSDILASVDKLINYNTAFEYVHIVGTTGKALWASLASVASDFVKIYKKPMFFLLEGRLPMNEETLDQYVAAMQAERKGLSTQYLQVCLAFGNFYRKDQRTQNINLAGYLTGFYSQAKESQSIGEVKSFPISEAKLLKLLPAGIEDYLEALNTEHYMTVRRYYGKENYFVTNACVMSSDTSDYQYAEEVRVSNRIVKAVRALALEELQTEIDPDDIEGSMAAIKEQLNIAIEDAIQDKIISSGEIIIDTDNLNILVEESIDVSVTYVPMGHVREMNIQFAVSNPYTKGNS